MKGYPNRFSSVNQKNAETEADVGKDTVKMWSRKGLECQYNEMEKEK
jgi:hypothetical protein